MDKSHLGEFALIAKLFAPLAARVPHAFGLEDDTAIIPARADHDLVVTTDVIVEEVDFFRDHPPALLAQKALRVNLSDLTAKGAVPSLYLLALSVASWAGDAWLAEFAAGLASDQQRFDVALLGGDTTRTPGPLTVAITAFGWVRRGGMIRRRGAQAGDHVFVSGTIGDAGAGLALLTGEGRELAPAAREALIARYRLPEPRVDLGPRLVGVASAALDVSDGLLADLGHIAEVSRVCIVLEAGRIPLSPSLRMLWGEDTSAVARAASAGDDYEIAFTAPPSRRQDVEAAARESGTVIQEIGRVEEGEGVVLLDREGKQVPVSTLGFTHL